MGGRTLRTLTVWVFMVKKTVFETEDGAVFYTQREADDHERWLQFNRFLRYNVLKTDFLRIEAYFGATPVERKEFKQLSPRGFLSDPEEHCAACSETVGRS
jgi:hypothetical protein